MIRFNRNSRTLVIKLPSWRDRRWLVLVLLAVALDLLVSYIDRPLAEIMQQMGPGWTGFFRKVTKLGDSKFYLVPLVLMLPFILAARQALDEGSLRRILNWCGQSIMFVFVAVAGSGLLVNLLKGLIGRTRPTLWFSDGEYGFAPLTFGEYAYNSMPSGHSNTVFALALALAMMMPLLRRPLLAAAALVAFSRVAITAHYLSDIVVGGALGVLTTLWLRAAFASRGWVFVRRQGQYRIAAPGHLLGVKIRTMLWEKFGLPDGARGRLP